ncbi:hypothetical protein BKN37_08885 [Mycobacterium talmoniae]|uniref:Uncharacterized protein n=1 Tax=Mycobacterium talmoniae TaxID=1858794 RepID=A0A1S1NG58_9MYCO|nr:hypothetical protein BKN37_08885 [Mycobacterium talmoniae]
MQSLVDSVAIKGQTASAIQEQAKTLINSLTFTAAGAWRMHHIVDLFSRDMTITKDFFTKPPELSAWVEDPGRKPEDFGWLNNLATSFVKNNYNPPVEFVANNHPWLPVDSASVPSDPSGPGPTSSTPQAGSPGGLPGDMNAGGLGTPEGLLGGTDPTAGRGQGGNPASALDGAGKAAQSAGDAAGKAANSAGQAGQGLGKAAQDAAGKLLNGKNGAGSLPEGALNLGSNSLNGAGRTGAGSGARSGGGGAGTGTRGVPTAKPSAQTVSASKAGAATPASRASLSNGGSGASGAGAPAGARGGGAAGKEHKVSKALRHAKYDVVEEGGAVLPVVGEEPKPPPIPTKST